MLKHENLPVAALEAPARPRDVGGSGSSAASDREVAVAPAAGTTAAVDASIGPAMEKFLKEFQRMFEKVCARIKRSNCCGLKFFGAMAGDLRAPPAMDAVPASSLEQSACSNRTYNQGHVTMPSKVPVRVECAGLKGRGT
jgi:hypothetical protein